MSKKNARTVPAAHFVGTLAANVNNLDLTDAGFRELFRNTQPIVLYNDCERIEKESREELSLDNLNRIFAGKLVMLTRTCTNSTLGLVRGMCIEFKEHADGGATLVITESKLHYQLIPDSISRFGDKIEGRTSKGALDRYRVELI